MVALEWLVGNDVSLLTSIVEHNVHKNRLGLQHKLPRRVRSI